MVTKARVKRAVAMRILVGGGFGYLGSHVSDYFFNKGHEVRILSRTGHPELSEWSQRFEVVTGDISDYASLEGRITILFKKNAA